MRAATSRTLLSSSRASWLLLVAGAAATACSSAPEPEEAASPPLGVISQALYSDLVGAGKLNGVEWQADAPWRLEPVSTNGGYDAIPITITFHDVSSQDGGERALLPLGQFCGLYVIDDQFGPSGAGRRLTHYAPAQFHELEASLPWLPSGRLQAPAGGAAAHALARVWQGDNPTSLLTIRNWAEWHGTVLHRPAATAPGSDAKLIVVAKIARREASDTADRCGPGTTETTDSILMQLSNGRVSGRGAGAPTTGPRAVQEGDSRYYFGDFLKVHLAEAPLPRFGRGWVYGDLHYHSQGTDNEGESGTNYRGVIQSMKAMGLDYAFATEHASDSQQLAGYQQAFLENLSDLAPWWVPDVIVDYAVREVQSRGPFVPILYSRAYRDMSPERFVHLHGWLGNPEGVNAQVHSSGGSTRSPQIFLGGEVDVVPEVSDAEALRGRFTYAKLKTYDFKAACHELPSELVHYTQYENVCESLVVSEGSAPGQKTVNDPQGLVTIAAARQHLVYLPHAHGGAEDGPDAFVSSKTTTFGGAFHPLGPLLHEQLDVKKKGYAFLAHPVERASGSDAGRFGPDIIPYSDTQLRTAFASEHVLGLQLWNEDTREKSTTDSRAFPFLYGQGRRDPELPSQIVLDPFQWAWESVASTAMLVELTDGTRMWDQMLRWGISPDKTQGLSWLAPGAPRRVFAAGGSDAHGDMNFRRTGRISGWSGAGDTALGKPRNLSYVGDARLGASGGVSQGQAVEALISGEFTVTDGPALRIAIDANHNGIIDPGDVPMGGSYAATDGIVPVLVEWMSSAEFGAVERVDLYVGGQAGSNDGVVYAPATHGQAGGGTCEGGGAATDGTSRTYCPMSDGYVRDDTGKLTFSVPPASGLGGTKKIALTAADYTTFSSVDCGSGCRISEPQAPSRLYVRAYAQTNQLPLVALKKRYAYTNPIWITSPNRPASPPELSLSRLSCSPRTVFGGSDTNTYSVGSGAGAVAGVLSPLEMRTGTGAWVPVSGGSFAVAGGTTGSVRARACNEVGCSGYAVRAFVAPTCAPPVPPPPSVHVEHTRCASGTNSFAVSVSPTSPTEIKIGTGGWTSYTGTTVNAGSRIAVSARARACSPGGCSGYASSTAPGPTCTVGGGGGSPF